MMTAAAARIAYGLVARRQGVAPFKERGNIIKDLFSRWQGGFSARYTGSPPT